MTKKKKSHDPIEETPELVESDILAEAEVPGTVEQERDDLRGRLQRLAADYQNYQKRIGREISQAREFANEQLIKALLGVLDDMERSLDAARENHGEADPLFQGMQLVHDKACETLANFGLGSIEALGQAFDPDKHAAMMQQPTADQEPMTILSELQKGYQLKGRTIRPAGVIVAVAPEEPVDDNDNDDESEE